MSDEDIHVRGGQKQRTLPWYTEPKYELQTIDSNIARIAKLCCRHVNSGYEYAVVEWRSGSCYLICIYREGRDVTPLHPEVVPMARIHEQRHDRE